MPSLNPISIVCLLIILLSPVIESSVVSRKLGISRGRALGWTLGAGTASLVIGVVVCFWLLVALSGANVGLPAILAALIACFAIALCLPALAVSNVEKIPFTRALLTLLPGRLVVMICVAVAELLSVGGH